MKTRQPIVIEFAGLYGSGKSTVSRTLTAELRVRGFSVVASEEAMHKMGRLHRWARYAFDRRVWRFFFLALPTICTKLPENKIGSKYNFRQWAGPGKDMIDRKLFLDRIKQSDFIVFDEGSINACVDLSWKYGLSQKALRRLLLEIPYLNRANFFLFKLNKQLCFERTGDRQGVTFIDYGKEEERIQDFRKAAPYFAAAETTLSDSEASVTKLDPASPVDLNVKLVLSQLGLN